MYSIISDIHGNLEALEAVLGAISTRDASRIVCLGDLVGYGPDSAECVRRSADWEVVVRGDWDLAVLDRDLSLWGPHLASHLTWLFGCFDAASDAELLKEILQSYRSSFQAAGCSFYHGSPRDVREWIFPEDVHQPQKLDRIADACGPLCVVGHSHIPGVFRRVATGIWDFIQPVEGERYEAAAAEKTIVTAGSVGQPRDGDPRACFLTCDQDALTFHRISYDVQATRNKILAKPEIADMHGERLLEGR